jgi:hypothetical protein
MASQPPLFEVGRPCATLGSTFVHSLLPGELGYFARMATRLMTLFACSLLLCSCTRPVQQIKSEASEPTVKGQATAPALRLPSAAEAFDLQSKCVKLGDDLLKGNIIGDALTHDQVSHYNPRDNRCYVSISVSTADLRTPMDKFIYHDYLYDGQTKEMLAYVNREGRSATASILDSVLSDQVEHFPPSDQEVLSLIHRYVSTPRHE